MWDGWHHMGGMWFWWLLGLVLLGVLVWALLRASAAGPRHEEPRPRERTPEEILKERYARGELDQEEFRRRMDDLRA